MFTAHDGQFVPFLRALAERVAKGVAVRLIHAKEPGPRFRAGFDQFAERVNNELFERILCPRVHTKAIVVDGKTAFVGSPNLTAAGLGGKHADARNFAADCLFDDPADIAKLCGWIEQLFRGEYCRTCRRRQYCPEPIIDLPD